MIDSFIRSFLCIVCTHNISFNVTGVVNRTGKVQVLILAPETKNNNSRNEFRNSVASKNKKYIPPL